MKALVGLAAVLLVAPTVALALDVTKISATAVDLTGSSPLLYTHESILLGLSCRSGPAGKIQGASVVRLGDIVSAGGKSFRVGVIEATRYNEQVKYGNEVLAEKGEVVCVLAPDEKSLPHDDDCSAIWVHVRNCRVVQ